MSDSSDGGLSRRERRERDRSESAAPEQSASPNSAEAIFGISSDAEAPAPATREDRRPTARVSNGSSASGRSPQRRRRRRWIWAVVILVVIAAAVGGALIAKKVYDQAMVARGHLVAAMPFAAEAQRALLASDPAAATSAAQSFSTEARAAAAATNGRIWSFLADVPLPLFENLRAVDTVSDIAVTLGEDVLVPASTFQFASLAPAGGRIDLDALTTLAAQVESVAVALDDARSDLDAVDRGALIDQVLAGVSDVDESLTQVEDVVGPARSILAVLPEALGADQPRNYLLMFLGNAEIRAGGGGPGSFILLRAENGGLTIAREAAATDFPIALPEPIIPLDPETEAVYSPVIGRYIANLTGTPDFPTTAALARGWWQSEFDDQIDGVIGIDPVALSYLLRATGPLALPTGETLTPDNAVALLLNEAYFEYPTGVESNVFFAGAAATVFSALTSGSPNPVGLVDALSQAGEEGRLKIWTADPEEQALLGSSQLAGVLPTDNTDETAVGVFINDTTGAKMDYYADAAVSLSTDQCSAEAEPSWTTTLTFTNSITREDAADLPRYITGLIYEPGDIVSDFLVYSPVGATIESWTLDGKEYPATSRATHLGRDVLRVALVTGPVSASTLTVTMNGAPGADADAYGPASVRSTPMVRDTPVTIDAPGCE